MRPRKQKETVLLKRYEIHSQDTSALFWGSFPQSASIYIDSTIIGGIRQNDKSCYALEPYCNIVIPGIRNSKHVFRILAKLIDPKDIQAVLEVCRSKYDDSFVFVHTPQFGVDLKSYSGILDNTIKNARYSLFAPDFYGMIISANYYTNSAERVFTDLNLIMTYFTSNDFVGDQIVICDHNDENNVIGQHLENLGIYELEFKLIKGSLGHYMLASLKEPGFNIITRIKESYKKITKRFKP